MAKTSIKQTSSARIDTMSIIPSSNISMGAYDPVYPYRGNCPYILTTLQPYRNLYFNAVGAGGAKRIYISITTPYSIPPLKTVILYPSVRL